MTTETTSKRPTHRVYAVHKAEDDKTDWTEIGAAWPHKDGRGFNLSKIDPAKLADAEIVIRKIKNEGSAP